MNPRVIAIDGPAGSGKTSTARAVARALSYAHLDSGALYRAVTLAALDAGAGGAAERILNAAREARVHLVPVDLSFRPEVSGVDVSDAIRSAAVTRQVSSVAALPAVRDWVNQQLRQAASMHPAGVVVDGRDIGTVVFPDALLKVFLTATVVARAQRRLTQQGKRLDQRSLAESARALKARDDADASRAVAPLTPAPDAVVLETTDMGFDQQVLEIVSLARRVLGNDPFGPSPNSSASLT